MDKKANFWQPKNQIFRILIAILLSCLVIFIMVVIANGRSVGSILLFLGVTAVTGIWRVLLKSAPEKSFEQISNKDNKPIKEKTKYDHNLKVIALGVLVLFFFMFLFTESFCEDIMLEEIFFSIISCVLFCLNLRNRDSGYMYFIRNISRIGLVVIFLGGILFSALLNEPLVDLIYKNSHYYYKYWDYKQLFIFFISFLVYSNILGMLLLINKNIFTFKIRVNTKTYSLYVPGDIVRLKSGGPSMVIAKVENIKIKNRLLGREEVGYICQWIDLNSTEPRKVYFNEIQLVKLEM
jgi:uncharacterized protein YodC (DUF2158 family)